MGMFDRDWLMVIFWRIHLALDWFEKWVPLRIVYMVSDWAYGMWHKRCYRRSTHLPLALAERERIRRGEPRRIP